MLFEEAIDNDICPVQVDVTKTSFATIIYFVGSTSFADGLSQKLRNKKIAVFLYLSSVFQSFILPTLPKLHRDHCVSLGIQGKES